MRIHRRQPAALVVFALLAIGCAGPSQSPLASAVTAPSSTATANPTTSPRIASPSLPVQAGTWSSAAPLPEPRSEIASAVLDGRLYVAGGFGNPRGRILDAFSVYDPGTDTWTELAKLPEGRHHGALTALKTRKASPGFSRTCSPRCPPLR